MTTPISEAGATAASTKLVIHSEEDRKEAHKALDATQLPVYLSLTPPKASDELTSRMHCAIRCVAQQTTLFGESLTEEEWKLVFVAAMYGQRVVRHPSGKGFIVLQKKTRDMSGPQKYDLTELVYSFGAERGVVFDEES
jgi:hypothetical protein